MQRVAIMEYLMEHRTHPTVEEIYKSLYEKMPMLSKTTVYNTLRTFAERKAILWLNIDDRQVHADGDTSKHIHFQCTKCGEIYDIPTADVPGSESLYINEIGDLTVNETHIYYKGICKKCKNTTV